MLQLRSTLVAFAHQVRLKRCELSANLLLGFALANDLFAVPAQEIINGFNTDPDGAGRFVFIEILETEIWRARLLDNTFDDAVDGCVVSAFEAGNFERHKIGMARGELRGPDLVIGAA